MYPFQHVKCTSCLHVRFSCTKGNLKIPRKRPDLGNICFAPSLHILVKGGIDRWTTFWSK